MNRNTCCCKEPKVIDSQLPTANIPLAVLALQLSVAGTALQSVSTGSEVEVECVQSLYTRRLFSHSSAEGGKFNTCTYEHDFVISQLAYWTTPKSVM